MKLFRYVDVVYSTVSIDVGGCETYGTTQPKVELYEYEVIKETKCGWWIEDDRTLSLNQTTRWISKRGHFAFPSIEAAKTSFLCRKLAQIRLLNYQLNRAQHAYAEGQKL